MKKIIFTREFCTTLGQWIKRMINIPIKAKNAPNSVLFANFLTRSGVFSNFFTRSTSYAKLSTLLTLMTFSAHAQKNKEDESASKPIPYTQSLFQQGSIFIGAQPEYQDFATLKSVGINKVINMRTPNEMEELKFYEDYLLKKAGINYLHIPIGGEDNPYSPEKLAEFASALEGTDGNVLLHCGSGYRASQLWAAYLVKHKGKSIDEALAMVTDMGWWPMPMETLLGKKLHVTVKE